MLYRPVLDIVPALEGAPATTAATVRFRISRQPRRLEAIRLRVTLTVASAITLASSTLAQAGGLATILDEVRVRVTDERGPRTQTQVRGMSLLSFVQNTHGGVDRFSQVAYATAGFPASGTVSIYYYIPIRHGQVAEPFGNLLSIPLDRIGEDVYVEASLNALASVVSAGITAAPTIALQAVYREVPNTVGYIPSELRSETWVPTTTANVPYEFSNTGFLTGFLLQGYTTSSGARAAVLASGGRFRLEYGRDNRGSIDEGFLQATNDLSKPTYPNDATAIATGGVLQNRNFTGESFFDLISDYPGSDAFAINSGLNLDSDALGGDKLRLFFNDYAATTVSTIITSHRLLPASIAQLKDLSAGI